MTQLLKSGLCKAAPFELRKLVNEELKHCSKSAVMLSTIPRLEVGRP
jgi:hypothetical protein